MKFSGRSILRWGLLIVQVIMLVPILWFASRLFLPRDYTSKTAEILPLQLAGGPFQTSYYGTKFPRGIVIIATGDGGWSNQWEEPLALHTAAAGFAVGGWDCRKFATTRTFGHAELVASFNASVAAVRKRAELPADCPVWYTGWSTGAEWAVAAAASPDRERHLVGVLSVSPGDVSRYGISKSDLLGLPPQGPDTYQLASFAPDLHGVAMVAFTGSLDPLTEVKWLDALHPQTPHKHVLMPGATHDMNHADPRFLAEFDMAVQWTLDRR